MLFLNFHKHISRYKTYFIDNMATVRIESIMLKKMISLFNQQPDLVADYLSAYAMLLRGTVLRARRRYARRAVWLLMMMILANASIIIGALSAMLWINIPTLNIYNVILVPSIFLLLTIITGLLVLYDTDKHNELGRLNYQLHQDSRLLARLREANE